MLGKYRLEHLLGRGGMGEVWAAYDPDLDRRVALKVLHAHVARAEDARARFQREGRAMARLRHPNVIAVHDATFSDGRGVIAMELVEGENLATWATRKHPASEIVRVILAAGRGLVAAHAAGMIHRDFKPHNVLIDREGRVLVTDFGLARATGEDATMSGAVAPESSAKLPVSALDATVTPTHGDVPRMRDLELDATATPTSATLASESRPRKSSDKLSEPLTQTGALLGTPAYMAPEQLEGLPADARADQFAFCVSVWELFAGERPFGGGSVAEIAAAIDRGERRGDDRLPRSLRSIIARGLAHDPLGRWSSMEKLLETIERAWKRPRRIAIALGALGVAGGVVAVFLATRPDPPPLEGCDLATDELAGVWSPSIRGDLERVLTGKSYQGRTLRFFDRWGDSWTTTRKKNCAKPNDPDFAPRRACLISIRDELGLMMSRASTFPPEMWSASDLVRAIPMPDGCASDPRGLAPKPPEPAVRDEVAKIRIEMATARAKMFTRTLDVLSIDMGPQLARARRTGYAPVIVEAEIMDGIAKTIRGREDVPSCEDWGEIAARADAAGYDRMVTEALLLQHECLEGLGGREDDADLILDRLETITRRTQNPLHVAQVGGQFAERDEENGRFDAALTRIRKTRAIYTTLELEDWKATAGLAEAQILFSRNRGDDLDRALAIVREVSTVDHERTRKNAARTWRRIAWHRGKIGDAPELALDTPDLSNPVVVDLTVRDANGPVVGARIAASSYLYADATREAMPDRARAVVEVTDADGNARLVISKQSTILVRGPTGIVAVKAPAQNGPLVLELAPAATVGGSTPIAQLTTDPTTLAERAARRSVGYVFLVGTTHPITWMAPIDSLGHWQMPAILPGRYRMLVQAASGIDHQARQRVVEIAPGKTTVAELALAPAPRVLEVTLRPGPIGIVIVFRGTASPPATWPALVAAAEAADELSVTDFRPASRRRGGLPGDMRAQLSVPSGPAMLCTFVLESYNVAYPVTRLVPEADTAPPSCRALTGEESSLVITPGGP